MIAAVTTWQPRSDAWPRARASPGRSTSSPARTNRCSTVTPAVGVRGSGPKGTSPCYAAARALPPTCTALARPTGRRSATTSRRWVARPGRSDATVTTWASPPCTGRRGPRELLRRRSTQDARAPWRRVGAHVTSQWPTRMSAPAVATHEEVVGQATTLTAVWTGAISCDHVAPPSSVTTMVDPSWPAVPPATHIEVEGHATELSPLVDEGSESACHDWPASVDWKAKPGMESPIPPTARHRASVGHEIPLT